MNYNMNFKVGQRVKLKGDHPWAGHIGEIVGIEPLPLLFVSRPRVYLEDSGRECYITQPQDADVIEDGNCHYE